MAYIGIIGSVNKQPDEKFPITADFTDEMAVDGDSISSHSCTSKNAVTGADTSSAILDGTSTQSGSRITQKIQAGASGEHHRVEFQVTTTQGKVYEAEIDIQIKEV